MKNAGIIYPHRSQTFSRRGILIGGTVAGLSSAIGLSALTPRASQASPAADQAADAAILNNALFYEHQAIWAYQFAATKLSDTEVGRAVLALARRNMADHMAHRDALAAAVRSLGATPVMAESSYDVSSYLQRGEGNLDSDVNIAKLALALETDAAIAYTSEVSQLKNPALISAGASIGSNESAHATAIRAAFVSLGVEIDYVPASFVSADTRSEWVLKV
ncbi:MAG: ferritin-like domain-containing protein [Synechococcales cyanobacterium C42_A2020_086]|jgi:rubrerythrin|nr:ferritin-like domain-containing protein [Synechococcales cyanobacterium C42_A2020_086]